MSATIDIDEELATEVQGVVAAIGCELVQIEFDHRTLRIFIERIDGGVTIDDCQTVSKQVSALLDVHDFGRDRYTLEVSSPGLDRKLYGPRDYERFSGHLARVTFFVDDTDTGQRTKRTIVGRLGTYTADAESQDADTQIEVLESDTQRRWDIPLGDIKVARLEIEL